MCALIEGVYLIGLKESLNKGVPVWAPIDIRINDLIEISDNKEKVMKIITAQFEEYMAHLKTIVKTEDIEYFQTMSAVIDTNTLERKVIFSPSGFLSTLAFNLNVNNICSIFDGKAIIVFNGDVDNIVEQFRNILVVKLKS